MILNHVELDNVIRALLLKHGAVIDGRRVMFPEGTKQEEVLPRLRYTERFTIIMPDGMTFRRHFNVNTQENSLGVEIDIYEQERRNTQVDSVGE